MIGKKALGFVVAAAVVGMRSMAGSASVMCSPTGTTTAAIWKWARKACAHAKYECSRD